MNEMKFDDYIIQNLPEIPPEDIVDDITPWRQAMDRVLAGIALTTITFRFFCLDYILPAIGMIALLLGFRALSKENKWFRKGYIITLFRAVYLFFHLIINATIYQNSANSSVIATILTICNIVLTLFTFLCLWKAIIEVQEKAELEPDAGSVKALFIWYLIICICGYIRLNNILLVGVLLIIYFFILRSLHLISEELSEAGYSICPGNIVVSDSRIIKVIISVLAIGILSGYLFFGKYPMKWMTKDIKEHADVEDTKEKLSELGIPENILDDMKCDDIMACKNASKVLIDINEYPLNDGREVEETYRDERWITTVYDVKELEISDIAIQLENKKDWIIIHHFCWKEKPEFLGFSGFFGTESIQLWPIYKNQSEGWSKASEVTGRILYNEENEVYISDYYYLGEKNYTSNDIFFGTQNNTDTFAAFSLPNEGESHRGYLMYQTREDVEGWASSSWVNYTHQQHFLQYPVYSAMEKRVNNSWNDAGAFRTIQDSFDFYIHEGEIEVIGD